MNAPFGIICAMDEELAPISTVIGKSGSAIVIKSGVGKVNAAIAAMKLIALDVSHVIVCGVAGSLDPDLTIGSLVISTDAVQHDIDVSALGFKPGIIPFERQSSWPADQALIDAMSERARALGIAFRTGRILTGDTFLASRADVSFIKDLFGGVCVDMETAAVAQVCHAHGVPWIALRTISDNADEIAPEDFPSFLIHAAERSAQLVQDTSQQGKADEPHSIRTLRRWRTLERAR